MNEDTAKTVEEIKDLYNRVNCYLTDMEALMTELLDSGVRVNNWILINCALNNIKEIGMTRAAITSLAKAIE